LATPKYSLGVNLTESIMVLPRHVHFSLPVSIIKKWLIKSDKACVRDANKYIVA
jgi:hypothetical protein